MCEEHAVFFAAKSADVGRVREDGRDAIGHERSSNSTDGRNKGFAIPSEGESAGNASEGSGQEDGDRNGIRATEEGWDENPSDHENGYADRKRDFDALPSGKEDEREHEEHKKDDHAIASIKSFEVDNGVAVVVLLDENDELVTGLGLKLIGVCRHIARDGHALTLERATSDFNIVELLLLSVLIRLLRVEFRCDKTGGCIRALLFLRAIDTFVP